MSDETVTVDDAGEATTSPPPPPPPSGYRIRVAGRQTSGNLIDRLMYPIMILVVLGAITFGVVSIIHNHTAPPADADDTIVYNLSGARPPMPASALDGFDNTPAPRPTVIDERIVRRPLPAQTSEAIAQSVPDAGAVAAPSQAEVDQALLEQARLKAELDAAAEREKERHDALVGDNVVPIPTAVPTLPTQRVALSGLPAAAVPPAVAASAQRLRLSPLQHIRVVLADPIDTSLTPRQITAVLEAPLVVDGALVAPAGSIAIAHQIVVGNGRVNPAWVAIELPNNAGEISLLANGQPADTLAADGAEGLPATVDQHSASTTRAIVLNSVMMTGLAATQRVGNLLQTPSLGATATTAVGQSSYDALQQSLQKGQTVAVMRVPDGVEFYIAPLGPITLSPDVVQASAPTPAQPVITNDTSDPTDEENQKP